MNKKKLVDKLLEMGADRSTFNILGCPKDFAYNLVSSKNGFDVYWQEKGLRTLLISDASFVVASKTLLKEWCEDFL